MPEDVVYSGPIRLRNLDGCDLSKRIRGLAVSKRRNDNRACPRANGQRVVAFPFP